MLNSYTKTPQKRMSSFKRRINCVILSFHGDTHHLFYAAAVGHNCCLNVIVRKTNLCNLEVVDNCRSDCLLAHLLLSQVPAVAVILVDCAADVAYSPSSRESVHTRGVGLLSL